MLNWPDYVENTYNWLNADKAKQVSEICKRHGATVKRLAQKRGALGVCKVLARFNRYPGWASNRVDAKNALEEIRSAGLINGLTFQD